MTLRHMRFCDECDCEIKTDDYFIGTEGIYVDGRGNGEGVDIVKDEDFCSPDCLFAFVRAKFQSVTIRDEEMV